MPAGKMILATKGNVPTRRLSKKYVTKKQMYKAIHSNIENKFIYGQMVTGFGSIGNSWNETALTTISQGTARDNRIGNVVTIKSIEIRGVIANGSYQLATDDPYNVIRLVIGLWNGSTTTPLGGPGWNWNNPLRRSFAPQGLMKKYYDKYIPLNVSTTEKGAGDGYVPLLRGFKYFKYFKKGIKIDFGSDATTSPDKRLIMSAISDSTVVSHPGFINGYWIVTYEDA